MNPLVIDRAFDLARTGQYLSVEDLKKNKLRAEGYSLAAITGPSLLTQLCVLTKAARPGPPRSV